MNKEKFEKFLLILDEIDNDYGFGPNEPINDYDKIDTYIDNFVNYSKDMLIYDSFCKLYEDESLSIMERINELR